MRLCLQAHERKNDVRQGEERERHTGQFAEHTVLRDAVRGDSLGLLLHLQKACEALINRGSSHFIFVSVRSLSGLEQGERQCPKSVYYSTISHRSSLSHLRFAKWPPFVAKSPLFAES